MKKVARSLWGEVFTLLFLTLAVFTLVSLFTFDSRDPSFSSNSTGSVKNACGKLGGHAASLLILWFGMCAFLFPVLMAFVGLGCKARYGVIKIIGLLTGSLTSLASLAVLAAIIWKYWSFDGRLNLSGGVLGFWLVESLKDHLNVFGTVICTLLVFSVSTVLTTPISVVRLVQGALKVVVLLILGAVWLVMRFKTEKNATPSKAVLPLPEPVERVEEIQIRPHGEVRNPKKIDDLADDIPIIPALPISEAIKGITKLPAMTPPVAREVMRKLQAHEPWKLPPIDFLKNPPKIESVIDRERLLANSQILRQKFADFGIQGDVTAVRPGPVITLYEFRPGPGVKVSRISALADDLSMALSAQSVRILAPLPGKSVVGIEIPSGNREIVYLREFLQHPDYFGSKHLIPTVMGKDISGQPYLSDLARMPHLLCAGQTGAGKSVFMNGLICSLFYRFTPSELRMILVDPKFIEFRSYQDIPHLLLPVVDDPKQASIALKWAVKEMDRRYRILAKIGARNLASFNQKVDEMGVEVVKDLLSSEEQGLESVTLSSGADWVEAFEPDESGVPQVGKLPYIVLIIDELADLMMIAKKDVEISIARIAQKARAAGIHLIIATQRPSTDVITGLIKANLPSRVSFQLASYIDSKTILDRSGAERLLGQGDMLFIPPGVSQPIRLHGAFLDDSEIDKITKFLRSQGKPIYRGEILLEDEEGSVSDNEGSNGDGQMDEKFEEAVELIRKSRHASASFLQRHLKIGYNRAARMVEVMEEKGWVGPTVGGKPREVFLDS